MATTMEWPRHLRQPQRQRCLSAKNLPLLSAAIIILAQLHNNYSAAPTAIATAAPTAAFVVTNRRRSNAPSSSPGRLMLTMGSSSMISEPWYISFFKRENDNKEQVHPNNERGEQVIQSFITSLNSREEPSTIVQQYFDDNIKFIDTSFYNPILGKDALTKHFYLHAGSSALSTFPQSTFGKSPRDVCIVVDNIVSSSESSLKGDDKNTGTQENVRHSKVCVLYHLEATKYVATGKTTTNSERSEQRYTIPDTSAITFYHLQDGKIARVFDVTEPPSPKPGDAGLRLLKSVSNIMKLSTKWNHGIRGNDDDDEEEVGKELKKNNDLLGSIIEKYFDAWNRRDISDASLLFASDCLMNDMQYESAFTGREELTKHLLRVKDCLPTSFNFVVDDIVSSPNKAGAIWHVENNASPLAFTRGCSFYTFDEQYGLIQTGIEIPEKAPPKMGFIRTLKGKFEEEPKRVLPATLWVAYMYILFFSDGILPGANVLAFEQRTWEEVRDLSLNFFLVAPMLKLSFSPIVHPMLEGVFNFLLSWAAMFAGFLSDERKDKPNILPFGYILIGMQFLTSGFLLPYLFTRTSEITTRYSNSMETVVYQDDIDGALQRKIAEWRPLGSILGGVGVISIVWASFGRADDFSGFEDRFSSFIDLLSIDRVGSSFIVDLVIFALFQSWFIDDDLIRRGVTPAQVSREMEILRIVAKYIPFFGLATYLSLRPSLPTNKRREQSIN